MRSCKLAPVVVIAYRHNANTLLILKRLTSEVAEFIGCFFEEALDVKEEFRRIYWFVN